MTINKRTIEKWLEPTAPSGTKKFLWDLETPGFGAWQTQRGRTMFVYQFRSPLDNRVRRVTLGCLGQLLVDQARALAKGLAFKVCSGIDPVVAKREEEERKRNEEELILRNFIPIWIAARELNNKSLNRDATRALNVDIIPALGDKHLAQITPADVEAMLTKAKRRSDSAVRRAIETLKTIMNYAKGSQRIATAATDAISTPKSGARDRWFTRDEVCRYLEALHDFGGYKSVAIQLAFLLLRRSDEVGSLRWEEIDQHTWTWTLPGDRVKTDQAQRLILPRQAIRLLEEHQPDPRKRRGNVFPVLAKRSQNNNSKGLATADWDALDAAIDRRIELHSAATGSVRPSFAHYTIHDGRSTAATWLQQKPHSFQPHLIEAALNHKSQEQGIKPVYQLHRYAEEVGDMLQVWCDFLDGLMSANDAWPGGRDLPRIEVDEREQRATNLRQGWKDRTKLARRSSHYTGAQREKEKNRRSEKRRIKAVAQ